MNTISICPVCYREIPATVIQDGGVWICMTCPDCGEHTGLVEIDETFYALSQKLRGDLIADEQTAIFDITNKCNMNCKYCYHPMDEPDKSLDALINELQLYGRYGLKRVELSGGEPTTRGDLFELVSAGSEHGMSVELITNGIKFGDQKYIHELLESGIGTRHHQDGDTFRAINISRHPGRVFGYVLENIRQEDLRVQTILTTINSIDDMDEALDFALNNREIAFQFRIRLPSTVWGTNAPDADARKRLYVSDLYKGVLGYAVDHGLAVETPYGTDTDYYRFNVKLDGVNIRLISWPGAGEIDLGHMRSGPYYFARSGVFAHFIHSLVINEGVDKGYINGRQICKPRQQCRQAA